MGARELSRNWKAARNRKNESWAIGNCDPVYISGWKNIFLIVSNSSFHPAIASGRHSRFGLGRGIVDIMWSGAMEIFSAM